MRKFDPYLLGGSASWFKIRNRNYLQWLGCEELFDGSAAPIQTIRDGKVARSCVRTCYLNRIMARFTANNQNKALHSLLLLEYFGLADSSYNALILSPFSNYLVATRQSAPMATHNAIARGSINCGIEGL